LIIKRKKRAKRMSYLKKMEMEMMRRWEEQSDTEERESESPGECK